jgi:AcrR family transcriptional regulator
VTEEVLTRERILEAAEEVLRRFGPAKATVVDVARALDVSHGSVYRHFPSKAALRAAVAHRWLERISAPLADIATGRGPAPERVVRWFEQLVALKRRRAHDDPELFATYLRLVSESGDVVRAHVDALTGQLSHIIADGLERGELDVLDPDAAARAAFSATSRFHNPAHAAEWRDPAVDELFAEVMALVLRGLGARRAPRSRRAGRAR